MAFKFIGNGIRVNETDVKVPVDLRKSADATAETGATPGTFSSAWYHRMGGATPVTAISLVTMLANGAHTPGGIAEIGDGAYELGLPDAAAADGADGFWLALETAASLFKQFYPLNYDAVLRVFVPQSTSAGLLTFDTGASGVDGTYIGTSSIVVDSTDPYDLGAVFLCTGYTGSSQVASGVWTRTPVGTPSSIICFAEGYVQVGAKLAALALSTQEKTDAQQEAEDALAAFGAATPGQIPAEVVIGLTTYGAATPGDLTAASGATPAQVLEQVVAGLTSYGAATPGDLVAASGATPSQVLEQVSAGLVAYGGATPGDIPTAAAIAAEVGAATPGDITDALTTYGGATPGDVPSAAAIVAALVAATLTESYATPTQLVTIPQALYMLLQRQMEVTISGTTMTVKKRDGSTTAYTLTLDSAATPTALAQAT